MEGPKQWLPYHCRPHVRHRPRCRLAHPSVWPPYHCPPAVPVPPTPQEHHPEPAPWQQPHRRRCRRPRCRCPRRRCRPRFRLYHPSAWPPYHYHCPPAARASPRPPPPPAPAQPEPAPPCHSALERCRLRPCHLRPYYHARRDRPARLPARLRLGRRHHSWTGAVRREAAAASAWETPSRCPAAAGPAAAAAAWPALRA